MSKGLLTKFLFVFAFGIFVIVVRGWLNLRYYPFAIGLIIGTLLPNIDSFIYALFLRPTDFANQQTATLIREKNVKSIFSLLKTQTQTGITKLVFHTAYFQLIFLLLTFWVITSSGSLFGIGLVLSFSLALLVDQLSQLMTTGNINSWFSEIGVNLDEKNQKTYIGILAVILIVIGLFL